MNEICSRCIIDYSDSDVSFDANWVCKYCRDWAKNSAKLGKTVNSLEVWEKTLVPQIKAGGAIIGLSGGVDSSYLCYVAKKYDLKPTIFHVDGGANSEIAKRNFKRVIEHTGFPWHTFVADKEALRQSYIAYLKADVIDTDVPADYLIDSLIRMKAVELGVKYVLTGGNFFIDAYMPHAWTKTNKLDYANFRNIIQRNLPEKDADRTLQMFPHFGSWDEIRFRRFNKIRYLTPLNFVGYNRNEALQTLQREWGYEDYGGKHNENIVTRFYQRYILPTKFGVDKRKANYSNLIRSGGITRADALELMKEPLYPHDEFESDLKFFLDFLQMAEIEFAKIMQRPPVPHSQYGSDEWVYKVEALYAKPRHFVGNVLRKMGLKK